MCHVLFERPQRHCNNKIKWHFRQYFFFSMWIENIFWGQFLYKSLYFENILKCNSNIFIKILLFLFIAILPFKIARVTRACVKREPNDVSRTSFYSFFSTTQCFSQFFCRLFAIFFTSVPYSFNYIFNILNTAQLNQNRA